MIVSVAITRFRGGGKGYYGVLEATLYLLEHVCRRQCAHSIGERPTAGVFSRPLNVRRCKIISSKTFGATSGSRPKLISTAIVMTRSRPSRTLIQPLNAKAIQMWISAGIPPRPLALGKS